MEPWVASPRLPIGLPSVCRPSGRGGTPSDTAAAAERQRPWFNADSHYKAGCELALRIALVRRDQKELQETYTQLAVKALRSGVAKGFRNVQALEANPDLEPLRSREAFQASLRQAKHRDK
jgi:hypothetical protein